jgi:hypothetical protein
MAISRALIGSMPSSLVFKASLISAMVKGIFPPCLHSKKEAGFLGFEGDLR